MHKKIYFSDDIELTTHEKSLLQKCLNLIHHRFPSVFHQQNYMTSNNTTTKTINEQGNPKFENVKILEH